MAFGTCTICDTEKAKYKCPKCPVQYCSLKCFKTEEHQARHDNSQPATNDVQEDTTKVQVPTTTTTVDDGKDTDKKYANVFSDDKIKYLLRFKALQVHLRAVYDILTDMTLTPDKRMDMANEKLNALRIAGEEENEIVEEFCERVTELLSSGDAT
ncbi:Protein HIT1 [Cyberlindnera fabianii]|uniref:Protein HIT1 n=1 Tax=Cyberlindnera fabianii TaxID=36022 RepID=A0A1V2LBR7_CYBFA|nr:Protein HIT1 [Cyberlindnera fabianii]